MITNRNGRHTKVPGFLTGRIITQNNPYYSTLPHWKKGQHTIDPRTQHQLSLKHNGDKTWRPETQSKHMLWQALSFWWKQSHLNHNASKTTGNFQNQKCSWAHDKRASVNKLVFLNGSTSNHNPKTQPNINGRNSLWILIKNRIQTSLWSLSKVLNKKRSSCTGVFWQFADSHFNSVSQKVKTFSIVKTEKLNKIVEFLERLFELIGFATDVELPSAYSHDVKNNSSPKPNVRFWTCLFSLPILQKNHFICGTNAEDAAAKKRIDGVKNKREKSPSQMPGHHPCTAIEPTTQLKNLGNVPTLLYVQKDTKVAKSNDSKIEKQNPYTAKQNATTSVFKQPISKTASTLPVRPNMCDTKRNTWPAHQFFLCIANMVYRRTISSLAPTDENNLWENLQ